MGLNKCALFQHSNMIILIVKSCDCGTVDSANLEVTDSNYCHTNPECSNTELSSVSLLNEILLGP